MKQQTTIKKPPMKLIMRSRLCPGDIITMTTLIREIKHKYPDFLIRVDTSCDEIFNNNPYIEREPEHAPRLFDTLADNEENRSLMPEGGWEIFMVNYGDEPQNGKSIDNPWSIHKCSDTKKHFAHGMIGYANKYLNLNIGPKSIIPEIYLTEEEKKPYSGIPREYWVVVCGGKNDYPRKVWAERNWEELFRMRPDTTFVQIGITAKNHKHPVFLNCSNVINLIDKTTMRQCFSLIHNSIGVISPITFTVPAAAALNKTSIIIAGGGEHHTWHEYPKQHFLHTCGVTFPGTKNPKCCYTGGCWAGQCSNLADDGEQRCMKLITAEVVAGIMRKYR